MNSLASANVKRDASINAVEDSNRGQSFAEIEAQPNRITIATRVQANHVTLSIADNGIGMPKTDLRRSIHHQADWTWNGIGISDRASNCGGK
jgi:nitrogen fixation/metabolism regulation signal transduction histidine kinase